MTDLNLRNRPSRNDLRKFEAQGRVAAFKDEAIGEVEC